MNIELRRAMTVEDYLAWGASQPERVRAELINGQVVLMAAEQLKHIKAKFALASALTVAIVDAGIRCHALTDGATIKIDEHTAYEPDAVSIVATNCPVRRWWCQRRSSWRKWYHRRRVIMIPAQS